MALPFSINTCSRIIAHVCRLFLSVLLLMNYKSSDWLDQGRKRNYTEFYFSFCCQAKHVALFIKFKKWIDHRVSQSKILLSFLVLIFYFALMCSAIVIKTAVYYAQHEYVRKFDVKLDNSLKY